MMMKFVEASLFEEIVKIKQSSWKWKNDNKI
jgi:hypothetical protein